MAKDVWELLETPGDGFENVASLWNWSMNYDAAKGPATLFLDLIGYSQEEFGASLYDLGDASLGYRELEELRDAITDYLNDPHGVRHFIERLITLEHGDPDPDSEEGEEEEEGNPQSSAPIGT